MTDSPGSEELAYDQVGRVLTEQRTTVGISNKTTTYTYDLAGDVQTILYPSGNTITYTYDSAGRPSDAVDVANAINYVVGSCSSGASTLTTGACYAPQGAVSQLQNGTNLISTYLFNTRLQPCWMYATTNSALPTDTTCTASDPGHGNILDLQYNFNSGQDNGNVIGITNNRDTTRSQNFVYDQVNRITTAETGSTTGTNCWGETYTYDQWANMYAIGAATGYTGCTQEGLSVSPTTNNQLSATGFSYDAAGNMLTDGANTYTYNAESEIATAAGATYYYDGDGKRVAKGPGLYYWYGAGSEVLTETNPAGGPESDYIYFGGRRVAWRRYNEPNIFYYEADMLGSARTMVLAGATTPYYDADYYPFGGERAVLDPTSAIHYKFEGKERDTETGNDDFGARYYSSRIGRWLSADWSAVPVAVPYANLTNPQTLNLYAMVSDNPESFADLGGHAPFVPPTGSCGNHSCPPPAEDGLSALGLADDMFQQEVAGDEIDIEVAAENQEQRQQAAQPALDELIGMGKELANTVIGLSNLVDNVIDSAIAVTGCSVRIGETTEFVGSNDIQKSAMAGAGFALLFIPEAKTGDAVKLAKSIASEAQMAEKGTALVGAGTPTVLRDAPRLAAEYGGQSADWVKMGSSNYKTGLRSQDFETHWYKNIVSGIETEYKTIMNWMRPDFKP